MSVSEKRDLAPSGNLLKESPLVEPLTISSREEQRALFGAIYSYLMTHTTHEVESSLTEQGVEENNILRSIAGQIVKNIGLEEQLTPVDALHVGLIEFVPEEQLKEWAYPTEKPMGSEQVFHATARYFYEGRPQDPSQR